MCNPGTRVSCTRSIRSPCGTSPVVVRSSAALANPIPSDPPTSAGDGAGGRGIVHEARALDDAFRTRAITRSDLAARTRTIGNLRADLRAAHLAAHLESLDVLSPEQVRKSYEMGALHARRAGVSRPPGRARG